MSKLNTVRQNPESGNRRQKFTRAKEGDEKKQCTREFKLVREEINEKDRTVPLAFSSDAPVERWGENEVLSHDSGDYDFSRLNDSHPLLLGHHENDPTCQIGVVVPDSAKVGNDKVGRCMVQFYRSALGEEIFQDVKDGIRKLVSVGYDRTGIVNQKKASDGMITTRYKWMPTHVAIVPVPADIKAGVGREQPSTIDLSQFSDDDITNLSIEQKQRMKLLLDPTPAAGGGGTPIPVPADSKSAIAQERARVKEITSITDTLLKDHPHCRELVEKVTREAIGDETSVADFQIRAMKEVLGAKPVQPILIEDLVNGDTRAAASYSMLRGIQSCLKRNMITPDGLEGEVHQSICSRDKDRSFEGFAVPHNAPMRLRARNRAERSRMLRDLNVSSFGQGGATVATELVTPIIEILRNMQLTANLGIQTMGGLSGNVTIPRQTGAATAYSAAESAGLTKSTQALDQILLSPHRVGAWNDYTRQLLLQSSIDVENFIRDDLMKVLALKWDSLILYGQGGGDEPLGMVNTPGISSVLFGGTATYLKAIAFETALAVLNADAGNMAFATSPSVRGAWKGLAASLTNGSTVISGPQNAIWAPGGASGEGEINGYRGLASNQILNNGVLFGNWSEIIHGLYGGYDVIVNPYSRDIDAAVRITVNSWGDVALRHAASFCVSADAGNQ